MSSLLWAFSRMGVSPPAPYLDRASEVMECREMDGLQVQLHTSKVIISCPCLRVYSLWTTLRAVMWVVSRTSSATCTREEYLVWLLILSVAVRAEAQSWGQAGSADATKPVHHNLGVWQLWLRPFAHALSAGSGRAALGAVQRPGLG